MSEFFEVTQPTAEMLAKITQRLLTLEQRQLTFEAVMQNYLSQLAQMVTIALNNVLGNYIATAVSAIPYVGPLLAPFAQTLFQAAPVLIDNAFSGLVI